MTHIHTQRAVGYNQCYTPTKVGMVVQGSGSMKLATVHLFKINIVFRSVSDHEYADSGQIKPLWYGLHAYLWGVGPNQVMTYAAHPLK